MRKGFMILERATFIAPSLKLRHVDTEIQAGRHACINTYNHKRIEDKFENGGAHKKGSIKIKAASTTN